MSARNRELFGLIPASLLVTAGFAGVFIQRSNTLSNVSLTWRCAWPATCSCASHCPTPTPTCSRWSRSWPVSGW
jgi:hypothetical protein